MLRSFSKHFDNNEDLYRFAHRFVDDFFFYQNEHIANHLKSLQMHERYSSLHIEISVAVESTKRDGSIGSTKSTIHIDNPDKKQLTYRKYILQYTRKHSRVHE